jgi:hypothetical protein
MAYNREGYAPWSLTRKAGVQSATVDGTIEVPQYIQPVLDTGFVDEKGDWKGTKSSDEQFHSFDTHVGIPNGGTMLTPQSTSDDFWTLDMTGFKDLFLAIKPTNGGNYAINAVMGPDTNSFANLRPVNPNALLRGHDNTTSATLHDLISDGAESCTADVWNIFSIQSTLRDQKLLQFRIVNNSGGEADVDFAFMRLVG